MFPPRQRDILLRRIARAIAWSRAQDYERNNANALAEAIVKELEVSGFSAGSQRRAIENIADRLEKAG